jgi:hypothetical protein
LEGSFALHLLTLTEVSKGVPNISVDQAELLRTPPRHASSQIEIMVAFMQVLASDQHIGEEAILDTSIFKVE